jgi:hypothetical protein
MILGSNPPRTAEGYWLLDWFAPWIDDTHPLYPTAPGVLRWAVYIAKNLKRSGPAHLGRRARRVRDRRRDLHAR